MGGLRGQHTRLEATRVGAVGALLLGYTETIIAFKISIEWSQIVSVAAVLITLIVRPAGFFGKRAAF